MIVLLMGLAFARPAPVPSVPVAGPSVSIPIPVQDASMPGEQLIVGSTFVNFTFTLDPVAALDQITDEGAAEVLLTQLAAHPDWRVTRREGAIFAEKRREGASILGGYHDGCWRVGIRLGETNPADTWSSSKMVFVLPSDKGVVKLRGWKTPACDEQWASALEVDGAISIEIYEAGSDADRPLTVRELSKVPVFVHNTLVDRRRVTDNGFSPYTMPKGEPTSEARFELSSPEPATLRVVARANAGKSGWAWVRIVDAKNKPWNERAIGSATLERLGGSPKLEQLFYFESRVSIPSGPAFTGTMELWIEGVDGEKATRVLVQDVVVPAR